MTKRRGHIFESVIALAGIPAVNPGTKGLVTCVGYRSMSILWDGRTQPADYEKPAILGMIQDAPKEPRPANRVSKSKKVEVPPAV